jgi:[acyl-carrier-protein] S-malonyltransferase
MLSNSGKSFRKRGIDMKLAMLFPGQGSQQIGMGKILCEQFETARRTFQEANEALNDDIQKLCFEGSVEELTKTINSQPAILTASVAAFRVYMEEIAVPPSVMAGHSLGEYTALVCAGSMGFADAVRIVRQRGRFMQEAVPVGSGAMVSVGGIAAETVEEECKAATGSNGKVACISNYNATDQIVISGHKEAIDYLSDKFSQMGANVIPLKVSAPFHCALMQVAAENLNQELRKYTFNDFSCPVIANVDANPYTSKDSIVDILTKQVVKPVRWIETMHWLRDEGIETAIEIGPKPVLKNLMRRDVKEITVYNFGNAYDEATMQNHLNQLRNFKQQINHHGNFMTVINRCLKAAICTKNNNWNNDEYQKGVVEPYRMVRQMQTSLEKSGAEPSLQDVEKALNMLRTVLETKKTPEEIRVKRLEQVFDGTGAKHLFPGF